ncbi:MAG: glutathione S-transferase family protein [Candidatus Andeanibacterium colombiense]|uniref:Glutathione S-transferase family protein n=1 Tax=Candidatus Andeanibacterium colombiense TaxID=3121345 RepID=A0AAJ5X8F1_9SPHN|nr:MAG: glutathione S-transferase family protein [Sphingomonadaceae bacterium]
MITIYHIPRTRSIRIVWLMEELGEEYRIERLSMPVPAEYLEISPTGLVPAIDDGDIRMIGSIAILQYLTGRRLMAGDAAAKALTVGPQPDPAAYAEHLQLLHFGEADIATPVSAIFRTQLMAKDGDPVNPTYDYLIGAVGKRLAWIEDLLDDGRTWATGENFTIADISLFYGISRLEVSRLGHLLTPNLAAYLGRLQARPAYLRAIEV